MPHLVSIKFTNMNGQYQLRLRWSNARHQLVVLKRLDPDSVKNALLEAAYLIGQEQLNGKL